MMSRIDIPGYKILEKIGDGTFKIVYRAMQNSTGQDVAIKLLRISSPEIYSLRIARFNREMNLCANLHHPGIEKLIDYGKCKDNQLFTVFEYIEGETLLERITRKGPVPADNLKIIMCQILEALAYAHHKGIIHRDLKPANIMISANCTQIYSKIIDFGMGGFLPESKVDYKRLTLPCEAIGTPSYAAPEQLRGEPSNAKSDFYSWGLVFLECLTGKPVVTGATVAEIIHQQLLPEDIPLPPKIASHPIAGLLRRVLAKKSADRVGNVSELLSEFKKIHLDDLVVKSKFFTIDKSATNSADCTTTEVITSSNLRNLTVLCCSLSLLPKNGNQPEFEISDTLSRTNKSLCTDITSKYGGYHAGSFGDFSMFYFGYPESMDSGARLAVRSALELTKEAHCRALLFKRRQNHRLELRAGIHSGPVHVVRNENLSGNTTNMAVRLAALAMDGQVLMSSLTRDRLVNQVKTKSVKNLTGFPTQVFALIGEKFDQAMNVPEFPIIGREMELKILRKSWQSARIGKGKAIIIEGEAGIGKSSLINAVCAEYRKSGAHILEVRCFPEYRNCALHTILKTVKRNLSIDENQDPEIQSQRVEEALKECRCNVEMVYPIFCNWFSLPLNSKYKFTPYTPGRQKAILFNALARILFSRLGSAGIFIIEDLHWADTITLEFANFVLKFLNNQFCLFIVTTRSESELPFRKDAFRLISLSELSDPESMKLLERYLRNKNISHDLKRRILDRADGLPLYIEKLARMVKEHDGKSQDKSFLTEIPEGLVDLLCAQIHRLGTAGETAQLCSVMGRELEYSLLTNASILDKNLLQADLAELIKSRVLIQKQDNNLSTYSFRHALLRDAVYRSIPAAKKREYHEAIDRALRKRHVSVNGHDDR